MLQEFKKFIMRGNILDMSVGIIIGAAFSKIADSLVNDILMPPIGLLLKGIDFSNIFLVIKKGVENEGPYHSLEAAKSAGAVVISYGVFIKAFNKMENSFVKKEKEQKEITEKTCPYCFSNINIKAVKCPNCTSSLDK
ncbi:large conductance mechanosensitive channel protein MscL [Brachyspira aalborgi]|uniref:large conductance mechanosensitive channel protein MscL n=1 Tax=Brachyspira aalborgi TaxID=29522 RepID=UPI00266CC44C|nr:large conductance mechanosensitive channel protein MscL [Brachyspira aalborgi]